MDLKEYMDENKKGDGKWKTKKEKRRENICLMDGLKGCCCYCWCMFQFDPQLRNGWLVGGRVKWKNKKKKFVERQKKCVTWKKKQSKKIDKFKKQPKKAQICRDNFSQHYRVCSRGESFKGTLA